MQINHTGELMCDMPMCAGAEDETSNALAANAPMALTAWKGRASLAIMVDRSETQQMMDKIEAAQKRAAPKAGPA